MNEDGYVERGGLLLPKAEADARGRVTLQIGELMASTPDDWQGHEEWPGADKSRYEEALADAMRRCKHKDWSYEMGGIGIKYKCLDCLRILDRRPSSTSA